MKTFSTRIEKSNTDRSVNCRESKKEMHAKIMDNRPESMVQRQIIQAVQDHSTRNASNQTGIPDHVRAGMEKSFHADFSNVRVHTNSTRAVDVGAQAFTQGADIHFAPGRFSPDSSPGRKLLGHELAHVVQQRQGRVKPTTKVNGMPVNDNPSLEKEADILGSNA